MSIKKIVKQTDFELLSFQKVHTANIVDILKKNSVALDASSTGTGTTFVALYADAKFNVCRLHEKHK